MKRRHIHKGHDRLGPPPRTPPARDSDTGWWNTRPSWGLAWLCRRRRIASCLPFHSQPGLPRTSKTILLTRCLRVGACRAMCGGRGRREMCVCAPCHAHPTLQFFRRCGMRLRAYLLAVVLSSEPARGQLSCVVNPDNRTVVDFSNATLVHSVRRCWPWRNGELKLAGVGTTRTAAPSILRSTLSSYASYNNLQNKQGKFGQVNLNVSGDHGICGTEVHLRGRGQQSARDPGCLPVHLVRP